jgi:hypothetical protein
MKPIRSKAIQIIFGKLFFEICLQDEDALFNNEDDDFSAFFTLSHEQNDFEDIEANIQCFQNTENNNNQNENSGIDGCDGIESSDF